MFHIIDELEQLNIVIGFLDFFFYKLSAPIFPLMQGKLNINHFCLFYYDIIQKDKFNSDWT